MKFKHAATAQCCPSYVGEKEERELGKRNKPTPVNNETRELRENSPFGGPAPYFAGVKNWEGVAGPFLNRVCFEVLRFGGKELWVRSQKPGVSSSEMPSAAGLVPRRGSHS